MQAADRESSFVGHAPSRRRPPRSSAASPRFNGRCAPPASRPRWSCRTPTSSTWPARCSSRTCWCRPPASPCCSRVRRSIARARSRRSPSSRCPASATSASWSRGTAAARRRSSASSSTCAGRPVSPLRASVPGRVVCRRGGAARGAARGQVALGGRPHRRRGGARRRGLQGDSRPAARGRDRGRLRRRGRSPGAGAGPPGRGAHARLQRRDVLRSAALRRERRRAFVPRHAAGRHGPEPGDRPERELQGDRPRRTGDLRLRAGARRLHVRTSPASSRSASCPSSSRAPMPARCGRRRR